MATDRLSGSVLALHSKGLLDGESMEYLRRISGFAHQEYIANRVAEGTIQLHHLKTIAAAARFRDQQDGAKNALCSNFFSELAHRIATRCETSEILRLLKNFESEFSAPGTDVEWVGGAPSSLAAPAKPGRGLDIGTANLVSAVQEESGGLDVHVVRDAFLTVRNDAFTRKVLNKMGVSYILFRDQIYVLGETAFELANLFEKETRRPMEGGLVSPKEQEALPIIKLLLQAVLGAPATPGELCYFSIPADPVDSDRNTIYHQGVFMKLLKDLGYEPKSLVEGHAVVLSELANQNFTGVGISCGGGMFNVCVSYRSLPCVTFSTTRGGDWIDRNVADAVGIPASQATAMKESGIDVQHPRGRVEEAIAIHYKSLIAYTLENIREKFENSRDLPSFHDPVEIVCSGGTSLAGGFIELFRDTFAEIQFPLEISRIRLADSPLNSVAQGCLLAALSETT